MAAAVKELNELRECWLNLRDWTETRPLEFPGPVNGPWSLYVDQSTIHEAGRVTPCAPRTRTQMRSRLQAVQKHGLCADLGRRQNDCGHGCGRGLTTAADLSIVGRKCVSFF
jgi:hypothetical protein